MLDETSCAAAADASDDLIAAAAGSQVDSDMELLGVIGGDPGKHPCSLEGAIKRGLASSGAEPDRDGRDLAGVLRQRARAEREEAGKPERDV